MDPTRRGGLISALVMLVGIAVLGMLLFWGWDPCFADYHCG